MDDSVSDDINIVSSDEEQEPEEVAEVIDDDDDDVEVVNLDGAGSNGGHESPGNDEVVVVDENIINLMEDSDDPETSDDEDGGGAEEEAAREDTSPASPPVPQSSTPPQPPLPLLPLHQENEDVRTRQTQRRSGPADSQALSLPGSSHTAVPEVLVSHSSPVPGPSVSQNPNSSLSDFQTPVLHRPLVSAALAAARPDESLVEFRSPKRRRLLSPVKCSADQAEGKSTNTEAGDDEEEEDGNCCSICFEPWDNSGRHRLASLKCGHLYGLWCIEKWLKGQGGKCPSCNEKAKMKDIRVIYAKAIKMVDTTERDRALQDLDRERERRRHAELEAAQARLQCQQCREESSRLREEVSRLQTQLASLRSSKGGALPLSQTSRCLSSHAQQLHGQFSHDKTVRVSEGGQCRVLAHCPSMAMLVVSQPSPNNLFPGFGIKKLSCMDFKTSSYLTLHQKAIRGLSFHPRLDDGLLLSVSMDKTVKLTSVVTNNVVQTYSVTLPVWSCEWNADNPTYFYVGQQNGAVLEFDTRSTASHLRELNTEGSKSPVVALQYMSRDVNATFRPGGVIVGQLDRVSFFESKGDSDHRLHILPFEGSLTSVNVSATTRHLLASFRPSAKHPTVRHQLCELSTSAAVGDTVVSCNVVETFYGGRSQSVLGRTMLVTHPADNSRLLVVAGDEPSESTHIWDTGRSQPMQRLACQGVPVDFSAFEQHNARFLAALTDKCLKLHRWNG